MDLTHPPGDYIRRHKFNIPAAVGYKSMSASSSPLSKLFSKNLKLFNTVIELVLVIKL